MPNYPNIANTDYFTNRKVENEKGEETGKVIMWRNKGDPAFHFIMKCPFCLKDSEGKENFTRRPYRPKCSQCGKSVTIAKIKPDTKGKE